MEAQAETLFLGLLERLGPRRGALLEARRGVQSALNAYLELLHQEQAPPEAPAERFPLRASMEPLLALHDALWADLAWPGAPQALITDLKGICQAQYHRLVDGLNAMSVVCDLEDRVLFLGDAPPHVVDHIHGSGAGFPPVLPGGQAPASRNRCVLYPRKTPAGDHYILSNGGYERRKVGVNPIKSLTRQPSCLLHCTDAHDDPARFCRYAWDCGGCSPTAAPSQGTSWCSPCSRRRP